MLRALRTAALTAVVVVVILVVVAIPLLFVYRSTCPGPAGDDDSYSFVPPWDDPPQECRDHERGIEVVADEVGL